MLRLARKLLPRIQRRAFRCLDILEQDYGHAVSMRTASCLDAQGRPIPWYTYPAIDYLRQLDFSQKTVFEFGAGHSTLFWGDLAQRVVSVEDDREWWERVVELARGRPIEVRFAPEKQAYVESICAWPGTFDVVVVDGRHRRACAQQALAKLSPGGLVILDNSNWYPRTSAVLRAADLLEVDMTGFGPINDYTWTTSFFFHRQFQVGPRAGHQPIHGPGSLPCVTDDD